MITTHDHQKIIQLLMYIGKTGLLPDLENKLGRLSQVESENTPPNLVTMNSELVFRDCVTDEVHELRLVYQLSPMFKNQVSVMSPLGTALLGARENSTVSYIGRDSLTRKIYVDKIKYQPEASGKLD